MPVFQVQCLISGKCFPIFLVFGESLLATIVRIELLEEYDFHEEQFALGVVKVR